MSLSMETDWLKLATLVPQLGVSLIFSFLYVNRFITAESFNSNHMDKRL